MTGYGEKHRVSTGEAMAPSTNQKGGQLLGYNTRGPCDEEGMVGYREKHHHATGRHANKRGKIINLAPGRTPDTLMGGPMLGLEGKNWPTWSGWEVKNAALWEVPTVIDVMGGTSHTSGINHLCRPPLGWPEVLCREHLPLRDPPSCPPGGLSKCLTAPQASGTSGPLSWVTSPLRGWMQRELCQRLSLLLPSPRMCLKGPAPRVAPCYSHMKPEMNCITYVYNSCTDSVFYSTPRCGHSKKSEVQFSSATADACQMLGPVIDQSFSKLSVFLFHPPPTTT
ncbi:hypothetical protein C8R44DRAFT_734774 [Mycena epipterygia]|nr:hypothetical protein C8R44DRAFT_734774 [Mycena epipterygia]